MKTNAWALLLLAAFAMNAAADPPVYLRAADFVGKSATQTLAILKGNRELSNVRFDKNDNGYMFRTRDGGMGIIMIRRGRAIAAQIELPEATADAALFRRLDVTLPGVPSFDQRRPDMPMWVMGWEPAERFQSAWIFQSRSDVRFTRFGVTWNKKAYEAWELFQ